MTISSTNPWREFAYIAGTSNCLPMDKTFIDAYNNKYKSGSADYTNAKLHLELFPEPFEGNPNAPIYLLGANPGYGDDDIWWCQPNNDCLRSIIVKGKKKECDSFKYSACSQQRPNYLQLMQKNLTHEEPFVFFNEDIGMHDGYKWWNGHISDEIKNSIFNIEYFPYHTKKADGLKAFLDDLDRSKINLHCGSEDYANYLIQEAMKNEKVIIITRMQEYWFRRIEWLHIYPKLYILLDHQAAMVKDGNVVRYSLFEKLKTESWKEAKLGKLQIRIVP